MRFLILANALLLWISCACAEVTAKSCSTPEHRQFDFWVGNWEVVSPAGKKLGVSRIERINDGCALLENWSGAGGVSGKSLNIYDIVDKHWHQFWVDSGASRLELHGGLVGGSMILASASPDPQKPDSVVTQRITWSKLSDGSVRQLWETSNDGGKTWSTAFDGKYIKRTK